MQTIQANKNLISFGQFEKQSGTQLQQSGTDLKKAAQPLPRQQTLHLRSQSNANIKTKKLGAGGLDDAEFDSAMSDSMDKLQSLQNNMFGLSKREPSTS